ncbi:transcription factor tau55-related [Fusarium longipes]|uniref:Transcription factor tau55-related n=1 Tax=Fusarium longipes TaxID=694270 RepID=A0A395S4M6_9HYPO|nr:transcription factor tau55-related [Fusarium longipes]
MTTTDEAMAADMAAILRVEEQIEKDEQEDWEYEYSTTETETFYLTLDLSYPEFKDRQPRAPHHSRGGYYKTWLDHNPSWRGLRAAEDNEDDNDNDPLPEPEADDDEPEIDPALSNDKGKGVDRGDAADDTKENGNKTEDIQILELHSPHPIISYKGRTFEGSWAEVVGTEAIFTSRDNENPLPALRQLEGNVDFLGACASRIATKETIGKPNIIREDPLAAIREEWNIRIPVGKDRSGERAQQTRFLENLMALKKRKGETDQVTVWAKDGEGQDFKDNRDPDYKPRRRRRLLNEDGEEVIPKREKRRASGRRGGRPRLRAGHGRGRGAEAGSTTLTPSATRDMEGFEGNLSIPTPSRWNELNGAEYDDMDQYDDQSETDDDDDEDMSMAD